MSNETMMLAKNLDLKKIEYPCIATEKLDGVPGVFKRIRQGDIEALTRQGEAILSVQHIKDWLYERLPEECHLIGELYVEGVPFKDIGGLVRRSEQSPELVLHIWDYYVSDAPDMPYADRMEQLINSEIGSCIYDDPDNVPVRLIPGRRIDSEKQLLAYCTEHTRLNPNSEGLIFRPIRGKNSLYRAGKRSWGFQRHKPEGTADLVLLGVDQAISKEGEYLGMAGRLICRYKGKPIGVGPGALTHEERIDLLRNFHDYAHSIVEVAYKPDPSYNALREARFKRWRDDKTKPNIE